MYNAKDTQVVLSNFLEWKAEAETQLEKWTMEITSANPSDFDQLSEKCRRLEAEIQTETDKLALEMTSKYEDALARLMCHSASIDPNFFREISKLGPVEPKRLRDDEVTEYERIKEITHDFLVKVGRN